MRLVSLVAVAAALVLAPAARATTAGDVTMLLRFDGTCASDAATCAVTMSAASCWERYPDLACTVDPVTFAMSPLPAGGVCAAMVLANPLARPVLRVHTTTYGDVSLSVLPVISASTVVAGYSTTLSPAAVLTNAGNGFVDDLTDLASRCATTWTADAGTVLSVYVTP